MKEGIWGLEGEGCVECDLVWAFVNISSVYGVGGFYLYFLIKLVERAPVLQTAFRSAVTVNISKVKAHHRIVGRVQSGGL